MRVAGSGARLSDYEIEEVREVYKELKSYAETSRALNISAGTVSRIVRRIGRYEERG